MGFTHTVRGNYGTIFIDEYFLEEVINTNADTSSAHGEAKADYDEPDDPGSPTAGEAAKIIGGVNFYLQKDYCKVSPPTNLQATPGDQQATISWDAITNAASYNLYFTNQRLLWDINMV